MIAKKIGLVLSGLILSFTCVAAQVNKIVIFGDSLSDNGNLYHYLGHIIPKSPPYYKGRFSNGPVWIEQLSQLYFPDKQSNHLEDYAVGGAGAVLSYKENLPFTLTAEVTDYLYSNHYKNKNKNLFIIWIGANNYLNGPTNVDAITTDVVKSIESNIKTLINHGASTFMVANLPDLGKTPAAIQDHHESLLSQLTVTHNTKLATMYERLKEQYPNVTFAYFDVNTLFDQLENQAQQYNISNTDSACYEGGFFSKSLESQEQMQRLLTQEAQRSEIDLSPALQQAILSNPMLRDGLSVKEENADTSNVTINSKNCDAYMFWDHVHPTTLVHGLLAQHAKTVLETAGISFIQN